MYVGIFGDVIFSVGHLRVLTPSNFKGTTGANWAEHEVLGGKARAEYLSPKLREYTFDILLDAALGVNPRKMLNRLTEMSENGEIHYLIKGRRGNGPESQHPDYRSRKHLHHAPDRRIWPPE